ncbi:MAG: hypothetical protein AB199_04330 [Parcubacteria bacterium C7867-004]|nr:MAG: hypothetical protein AB199_04330 [Parcubacteria bacterium C7867-004]
MDAPALVPATPEKSLSKKRLIVISILIAVLLIIVGLCTTFLLYQPAKETVGEAIAIAGIPEELKKETFLFFNQGIPYPMHVDGLEFSGEDFPGYLPPATMSPDMQHLVASEIASTSEKISASNRPVLVRSREGGSQSFGMGFEPAFLDNSHIVYFTATGIVVTDIVSGKRATIYTLPKGARVETRVRYSRDRSLVLWVNDVTRETTVARIGIDSYESLGTSLLKGSTLMGNEGLYELRPLPGGTELWGYDLTGGGARHIQTFPSYLGTVFFL